MPLPRRSRPTATRFFLLLSICASACGGSGSASPQGGTTSDAAPDVSIPPPDADASSGLTVVPLSLTAPSSCLPNSYTAAVTIGGSQRFQLAVDTGSASLAVASTACTSCGVTPEYTAGSTATDEHAMGTSAFGNGSSWSGEIYQDSITVGPSPDAPVRFVAINTQTNFFAQFNTCDTTAASPQGIIGLGPSAADVAGTTAFFDQAVADAHMPNIFATELCEKAGTLWLGGYDPTSATAPPQFTPMSLSAGPYYALALTSITVAGQTVPIGTSETPDSIVDTGASSLILPSAAFAAITAALEASPGFQQIIGPQVEGAPGDGGTGDAGVGDAGSLDASSAASLATWFANIETCAQLTQTKEALDAALPPLTLVFGSNPPVSVQASATESYLVEYNVAPYGDVWCNALGTITPNLMPLAAAVIGSPVLRSNIVIFDRANQRIGFAPHAPCP